MAFLRPLGASVVLHSNAGGPSELRVSVRPDMFKVVPYKQFRETMDLR